TAYCARPCHSIFSANGPFFHAASKTSCALNARPSFKSCWAKVKVCWGGRFRSSGIRGTPTLPIGSGRPRRSRGRGFRARPASSRGRSTIALMSPGLRADCHPGVGCGTPPSAITGQSRRPATALEWVFAGPNVVGNDSATRYLRKLGKLSEPNWQEAGKLSAELLLSGTRGSPSPGVLTSSPTAMTTHRRVARYHQAHGGNRKLVTAFRC